jgi:hypothetical protein
MYAASYMLIGAYRRAHAHTFSHIRHRFLVENKGLGLKKSQLKALYKSAGVYVSKGLFPERCRTFMLAQTSAKNIYAPIIVTKIQICLYIDPSHRICR